MGTKKSINFIEEADALNELDLNALAGGFALADDCPYNGCILTVVCQPSSCLKHNERGNGPVAS